MNIVFYSAPMSSATPVASALDELQVPHERVVFDLAAERHRTPEFLALNPNGKVPTLVVDGAPMFEALAIVQWLGDRFGVARGLWPAAASPARLRALSWSTWSYVTYGAALGRLNTAQSPRVPAALHNPALATHTQAELSGLLALLDGELARAPYLLGAEFSLLDLIVTSVVLYGTFCGASVDAHPHVAAWSTRCAQRPSIARAWGR
jgi:glutathione S-transferase